MSQLKILREREISRGRNSLNLMSCGGPNRSPRLDSLADLGLVLRP
jgi:hypothetical protein